jgi:choline kinase
MNAVILTAGQGKRLLPLTADNPKCLVNIAGQSIIGWQIDERAKSGMDRVWRVDAESIGMILFREKGPLMFRKAVEKALQDPAAIKKGYLSVIGGMAESIPVWTISANGLQWCEVDFPADLQQAQRVVRAIYEGNRLNGSEPSKYAWG